MSTHASSRPDWEPFGLAAGLRGMLAVSGMALLLAGCGRGSNPPSSSAPAKPATAAVARSPHAPVGAPAQAPAPAPAAAASTAQVQQQAAVVAKARLDSMSVPDLLAAARDAYAQHRLVAPAGDNAMEYYEAVLARDPANQVAKDALREAFPFGVPDVEQAIGQNNFDEAGREIDLLAKADPTNYTLTLLRSRLDAQKKLQARQQQQAAQLQAQKAAELAAAQQAAAQQAAAEKAAVEKAAAEKLAAQQAAAKAAAAPRQVAASPNPAGETRPAKVISPSAPEYPLQAARNQTSGYAVVEFTISASGAVQDPHVVDSAPRRLFDNAAIQAVRHSKFDPALQNGKPVSSVLRRRIDFKFQG
jgi:protein TonB